TSSASPRRTSTRASSTSPPSCPRPPAARSSAPSCAAYGLVAPPRAALGGNAARGLRRRTPGCPGVERSGGLGRGDGHVGRVHPLGVLDLWGWRTRRRTE